MIDSAVAWLNTNAGAVQAIATIVLVLITAWYALRTHHLTSATQEHLRLIKRAQEPDLLVTLSFSVFFSPSGSSISCFSLSAANRGQRPVTVEDPFIQLPNGQSAYFIHGFLHQDGPFPRRLEPGEGCSVVLRLEQLVSTVVTEGMPDPVGIKGAYRDKAGNLYTSSELSFSAREWAKTLRSL
jgi:hypothetical protein